MPVTQASDFGPGAEFGVIDVQRLNKEFPGVTQSVALAVARESGMDPSDPKNLVKAMYSKDFEGRINKVRKDREGKFIQGLISNVPQLPAANAPAEQQIEGLRGAQEGAITNRIRARGILGGEQAVAADRLAELADLDRETFKSERVKELDPTSAIDSRMLALRMQAFTAKSMLRNELKGLRPSLRSAAISARMQVFSDAIGTLKEIRDAKRASAEDLADREFDSKMEQKRTATARVNALRSMMDHIEETGDDTEALASIRMDYLKESKKLEKSGRSGVTDEIDLVKNAILNNYLKTDDETPNAEKVKEAERQAKDIVRQRNEKRKTLKNITPGMEEAIRQRFTAPGIPSKYTE